MTDRSERPGFLPSRRIVRALLIVAILAVAAMWVYAFVFAPKSNVNAIGDDAWTTAGAAICTAAREQILDLPTGPNPSDTSPEALQQRAEIVEQSNAILDRMLTTLESTTPNDQEGARIAKLWLSDYRTLLRDRVAYVAALRAGTATKFSETMVDGQPITNFIGDLARQNRMGDCQPPALS